jgi:hypothetical protein
MDLTELITLIKKEKRISINTYITIYTKLFNFSHSLKKNHQNTEYIYVGIISNVLNSIKCDLICENDIDEAFSFAKLCIRFISIFELLSKSIKYLPILQNILNEYGYTKKWCFSMLDKIEKYEFLFTVIEPKLNEIMKKEEFINMEIVQQFLYYSSNDDYMEFIDDWTHLSHKIACYMKIE